MAKSEAPSIESKEKSSAKAVARYLRISPRKVRLVINSIRFKPTGQAMGILMNLKKKAARMTEKVLKSAVANAKVLGMDESRLYISDIRADGGPVFKRFMSRSMGRADRILKRTTHLSMTVSEGLKVYQTPEAPGATEGKEKVTKKKESKSKTKAQGAKAS